MPEQSVHRGHVQDREADVGLQAESERWNEEIDGVSRSGLLGSDAHHRAHHAAVDGIDANRVRESVVDETLIRARIDDHGDPRRPLVSDPDLDEEVRAGATIPKPHVVSAKCLAGQDA